MYKVIKNIRIRSTFKKIKKVLDDITKQRKDAEAESEEDGKDWDDGSGDTVDADDGNEREDVVADVDAVTDAVEEADVVTVVDGVVFSQRKNFPLEAKSIKSFNRRLCASQSLHTINPSRLHPKSPTTPFGPDTSSKRLFNVLTISEHFVSCITA